MQAIQVFSREQMGEGEMEEADCAAVRVLEVVDGMKTETALLAVIGAFSVIVSGVAIGCKMELFDAIVKSAREHLEETNLKGMH